MDYMAKWGSQGFLVSPTKIAVLQGLSTTVALKTDSESDTSGTAQTNTRGKQLQPVSFSATYHRAAGFNPRTKLEEWQALVGQKYPLYIGNKRFGPALLLLKQVDASDIQLSDSGETTAITIKFTFEEFADGQTATNLTSGKAEDEKKRALNTTASESDRNFMKPPVTSRVLETRW